MPMGAETAGRMQHAADRRWRFPDVEDVSLDSEAVLAQDKGSEGGIASAAGEAAGSAAGSGSSVARAWESALEGSIRLSPAERANPAFAQDGSATPAGQGAYGGRGPRYDGAHVDESRIDVGGSTGRWVRTGGCGVRWFSDDPDNGMRDDAQYWRWVSSSIESAGAANADEGPKPVACGDFAYLENGDGTVTLVSYDGDASDVEIPETVDDLPVSVLGASLFAGHGEIESVALPGSLVVIDEHAFDGCASLTQVDLPAALQHIGMLAFAKSGLTSISIPPSVKTIGQKAFFHCKRLQAVTLVPGLRSIGEMAFTYTGIGRVHVPATVSDLGFNAFDLTPAQKYVADGTIEVDPDNRMYRFDGAGFYRLDSFVELIGDVREYSVAAGTRKIADGAFKRHPTLAVLHLPEGLVEIGDDAFRSNRKLVQVDLPESLQRLGARAFVDTSVLSLRISRNVAKIGENALLVQGESQMRRNPCLQRIDLDPANEHFYLENGLFCERDASPGGGDTCLLYVGPDNVIRIPDSVTTIATMAFGSTDGVDELFVHDHVHSFCYGWLSTERTVPRVHVDFGEEVDGYKHGDFLLPSLSSRFRYPTSLFVSYEGKTYFDFDYYDSWVTCTTSVDEFAPAAYERLRAPMGMTEHTRGLYEGIFARKSARICRYFAERGQIEAIEFLLEQQLIDEADIGAELEVAMHEGRGQATACLLEVQHRIGPADAGGIDFSL